MEHTALTQEQLIPLQDIKEGIQLYKKEMESQIRAAKINTGIGIGIALLMLVFFVIQPELLRKFTEPNKRAYCEYGHHGYCRWGRSSHDFRFEITEQLQRKKEKAEWNQGL